VTPPPPRARDPSRSIAFTIAKSRSQPDAMNAWSVEVRHIHPLLNVGRPEAENLHYH
jgi:hypothetical protein